MRGANMKTILENNRICAIMRNVPLRSTLNYVKSAYEGGISMFEVAMNSSEAVEQIEIMRDAFDGKIWVGAGTVINPERCQLARAAGAQFFLTPSVTISTLEFCRKYDIPLLPGVLTPTDVAVCLEYNYTIMKLFPAGDMPPSYIKSLKGPYDGTEYVAVGGVKPENISDFLKQGYIGVGIGSNLMPKEYLENEQWDKAREYVEKLVKAAKI